MIHVSQVFGDLQYHPSKWGCQHNDFVFGGASRVLCLGFLGETLGLAFIGFMMNASSHVVFS
jgi:hypothetical protein